MKTTLTTYVKEEQNSGYWTCLVSVKETGETKVYKEHIRSLKVLSLRDIVKRAKLLQNLYSSTDPKIEEFCKKFSNYSWGCEFRETVSETTYHSIRTEYPVTLEQLHEKVCKFAEIKQKATSVGNFYEYERLLTDEDERKKLQNAGIKLGENAILLDSNKYLVNDYGKYCSGITFIIAPRDIPNYEYFTDRRLRESLNIFWDGTPSFMYGNYWKSKKGSNCFAPCDKGHAKHLLIRLDWGGCFNSSRGSTEVQNTLYSRRASSNGGGTGYSYYIIPIDSKNTYSEDDI